MTLAHQRVPKLLGADHEFGNFILGRQSRHGTGRSAARILLAQFSGYPRSRQYGLWSSGYSTSRDRDTRSTSYGAYNTYGSYGGYVSDGYGYGWDPQDWGRKWLANGSCVYIDLDHIEYAISEQTAAARYTAACAAMNRAIRGATETAQAELPAGERLITFAANSDGFGASFGAHLNVLLSRPAWESLFHRRLQQLLVLVSHQVSSIIYTGLGKVGSENDAPPVPYQISQRADFFETLVGPQTTWNRPIANSRDENLAGAAYARLHCIFYDHNLMQTAAFLKAGAMQIVTSMIEGGWCLPSLVLDDPLEAVIAYSHDPTLRTRARLADGRDVTALELQSMILDEALKHDFEGLVPDAPRILALWGDTLERLRHEDFDTLSRRLDWVLKWALLDRARSRANVQWDAPKIKHLDQLYSSLDRAEGLYLSCERAGLVDRIASEEEIAERMETPPSDTRAFTRARLLELAGDSVDTVDWDRITVRDRWRTRYIRLPDPLAHTAGENGELFEGSHSLDQVLDALDDGYEPYWKKEKTDELPSTVWRC